jgi:hypothetical protein
MRISQVLLSLVLGSAPFATASSIVYTESAIGSGSLGSTTFTDVEYTLTLSADTSQVVLDPSANSYHVVGAASLFIDGIGGATFTDTVQVADNYAIGGAGFGDVTSNFAILFTSNPAFSAYDLQTAIGPDSGASFGNPGFTFNTTAGAFGITSSNEGDATFTATLTAAATPEPIETLPLIASLLGLWALKRRRT